MSKHVRIDRHVIAFERPDDEKIIIYLNGYEIGCANHDEHGWSGMNALEQMAREIAEVLDAKVIES